MNKKRKYTKKLTSRQKDFINAYLELGVATEAYKRAYSYENMTPATISRKAYDVLHSELVEAEILKVHEKQRRLVNIDKERILFEVKAILEAKITDYLEFDGTRLKFKDFSQLTESQVRAIEGIKQTKEGFELKIHGKAWTIERICKMLGYDKPEKMIHEMSTPFATEFTITYRNGSSIEQSTKGDRNEH